MPVYEYICQDCHRELEVMRPMREADAPIACEGCSGKRMQRKLSLFFAQSAGQTVAGTSGKTCSGCSGGSCASCGR